MFSKSYPVFLLILLLLTACEDPSNVGLGLLEEDLQGDAPSVAVVPAETFTTLPVRVITGGNARVLAGEVADPLFGTITTTGFLDFLRPSGVGDAFEEGEVTAAELRLVRNYVYGDTTRTVTLRLRTLPDEFDADDAPADTTLPMGEVVREFSFSATDTLVVVPLPETYLSAQSAALRSEDFNELFHGFVFEPVSDEAVVGFAASGSTTQPASQLRVVAGGDTVSFPVGDRLTAIERTTPSSVPAGFIPVQTGVGPRARVSFDFEEAGVSDKALNRAVFQLFADTTFSASSTPAGFFRPPLDRISLLGVTEEGRPVFEANGDVALLVSAPLGSDGRYALQNPALTSAVQRILLGALPVDRFEVLPATGGISVAPTAEGIEIRPGQLSIDPVLLFGLDAGEKMPTAILTISEIRN